MIKFLRIFAALILFSGQVFAQATQVSSGSVIGNPTAARAPSQPATITAMIDRALSSTQGSMLYRNATVWVALAPGTVGLPLLSGGAGANLAYGIPPLSAGGTGANLTASNGGIFYSTGTVGAILSGTATAGQIIRSGSSAAPSWSTATYPATTAAGTVLASASANTLAGTATPTLGVAGSVVGSLSFANATSGGITLQPVAGALGTAVLTLPAATDTVAVLAASQAFTNKTYNGNSWTAGTGTLTIAAGKTLTADNSITISGTDGKSGIFTTTLTVNGNDGTLAFGAAGKTATFNNSIAFSGTDSTTMTFPSASANIPQRVASGTLALATSAISSATCTSAQTAVATGTATTDVVNASFNGDPVAVTGYVPLTSGMLTIIVYPTADTFNAKVCNNTTASITPGAITLNWQVLR